MVGLALLAWLLWLVAGGQGAWVLLPLVSLVGLALFGRESLDELEALREEVRRLTQANGDLRKERDRAVAEAQRQDGVAKGLRKKLEAVE